MARVLGYGGLANTNGARDFTGRTPFDASQQPPPVGADVVFRPPTLQVPALFFVPEPSDLDGVAEFVGWTPRYPTPLIYAPDRRHLWRSAWFDPQPLVFDAAVFPWTTAVTPDDVDRSYDIVSY